jgi:hypothetical protein
MSKWLQLVGKNLALVKGKWQHDLQKITSYIRDKDAIAIKGKKSEKKKPGRLRR